jgi:hypothetical protein
MSVTPQVEQPSTGAGIAQRAIGGFGTRAGIAVRALAAVAACLLVCASSAHGQPAAAPAQAIVSGLPAATLGGLAIARDGSGGLIYEAGNAGVFVSRLVGGQWQTPIQLDAGLGGSSVQGVIAAGNGGVLLTAFVNGGTLYTSQASSSTSGFSTPQAIASTASNPQLSLNNFGVGYLTFTAADGSGDDVDVDYWNGTSWAPASPQSVNVTPGDQAGTGNQAPDVVAAGDGVGIVTWGEAGHVYARRVWGTATSVAYQQLDPPGLNGWAERSADSPEISAGGDSSYPDVAFREQLQNGSQQQDRVLITRLIAENVQGTLPADGQSTPGAQGAGDPQIAMNEYGRGFATAVTDSSHSVIATQLDTNGAVDQSFQADPGSEAAAPYAQPGLAGLTSTDLVWQQSSTPLVSTNPQIVIRYAQNGRDLAAPVVLSSPSSGPTDAADGLWSAGDTYGDAAVAWVQGSAGSYSIQTAQLYQPPGQPQPNPGLQYVRTATPGLSWQPARDAWGPLSYTVTLDSQQLGQTAGTSITVAAPLIDGPHTWSVTASNPAGETNAGPPATVFVDTYPPRLRIRLTGRMRSGQRLKLTVAALDTPNPTQAGAAASGIGSVSLRWGDRSAAVVRSSLSRATHVYRKRGLYRLTVTATDRAGNATTIQRYVRIIR